MDEKELFSLAQTVGPNLDFDIFKVILDLLKLDVNPDALFRAIQKISVSKEKSRLIK